MASATGDFETPSNPLRDKEQVHHRYEEWRNSLVLHSTKLEKLSRELEARARIATPIPVKREEAEDHEMASDTAPATFSALNSHTIKQEGGVIDDLEASFTHAPVYELSIKEIQMKIEQSKASFEEADATMTEILTAIKSIQIDIEHLSYLSQQDALRVEPQASGPIIEDDGIELSRCMERVRNTMCRRRARHDLNLSLKELEWEEGEAEIVLVVRKAEYQLWKDVLHYKIVVGNI